MIGLIDIDSKIPNLALMKLSSYYQSLGERVEFAQAGSSYEKIYTSAVFTKSKTTCEHLIELYGSRIEIGGTGWDIDKKLEPQIERMKPDYDLYSIQDIAKRIRGIGTKDHKIRKATEIVNAGMGFTSRGCIRKCGFCMVPRKEGEFCNVAEIKDLLNPRSNILILHDNNFTADPYCIDKLQEIRDRGLIVDINQGCDIRLMTDDIAKAMSEVKHLRSIHYAWDLMGFERQVMDGIRILNKYIKPYRQMCFMLTGFNTTFEEDVYRFEILKSLGIKPYVMVYNDKQDERLHHFERWVNSSIYTACDFKDYTPWQQSIKQYDLNLEG